MYEQLFWALPLLRTLRSAVPEPQEFNEAGQLILGLGLSGLLLAGFLFVLAIMIGIPLMICWAWRRQSRGVEQGLFNRGHPRRQLNGAKSSS